MKLVFNFVFLAINFGSLRLIPNGYGFFQVSISCAPLNVEEELINPCVNIRLAFYLA